MDVQFQQILFYSLVNLKKYSKLRLNLFIPGTYKHVLLYVLCLFVLFRLWETQSVGVSMTSLGTLQPRITDSRTGAVLLVILSMEIHLKDSLIIFKISNLTLGDLVLQIHLLKRMELT